MNVVSACDGTGLWSAGNLFMIANHGLSLLHDVCGVEVIFKSVGLLPLFASPGTGFRPLFLG